MNFGEWKARLEYRIEMLGYALYLYQDTSEGRVFLNNKGERVTIKSFTAVKMSDEIWFALFEEGTEQVVVDAFAKVGVKPSERSKTEGLLEATDRHLQDMRTLVFKRPPTHKGR